MHNELRYKPVKCSAIIASCAILHNFAKMRYGRRYDEEFDDNNAPISAIADHGDNGETVNTISVSANTILAIRRRGEEKRRQIIRDFFTR